MESLFLFVCLFVLKIASMAKFVILDILLATFSVNVKAEIVSAPHKDMRGYYTL